VSKKDQQRHKSVVAKQTNSAERDRVAGGGQRWAQRKWVVHARVVELEMTKLSKR